MRMRSAEPDTQAKMPVKSVEKHTEPPAPLAGYGALEGALASGFATT